MDLVILIVLIVIVVCAYKDIKFVTYLLGILEIFFRIMHFVFDIPCTEAPGSKPFVDFKILGHCNQHYFWCVYGRGKRIVIDYGVVDYKVKTAVCDFVHQILGVTLRNLKVYFRIFFIEIRNKLWQEKWRKQTASANCDIAGKERGTVWEISF